MPPRLLGTVVLVCATAGLVGCNVELGEGGALVNVFTTHHATPESGMFPERGGEDQPRTFDAGDGWTVTLAESYITIAEVRLVSCGGSSHNLKMFWGPCPEDLRNEDLEPLTVAGLKVPPGDYCELQVTYSPYEMPVIDEDVETRHTIPDNEDVDGSTIFMRGVATRGEDEEVPFELANDEDFTVDLDLSELEGDGNALTINHKESFPIELTVSKTYDRFFDGVDWAAFDPNLAVNDLDEVLEDQTRVAEGTRISVEDFED